MAYIVLCWKPFPGLAASPYGNPRGVSNIHPRPPEVPAKSSKLVEINCLTSKLWKCSLHFQLVPTKLIWRVSKNLRTRIFFHFRFAVSPWNPLLMLTSDVAINVTYPILEHHVISIHLLPFQIFLNLPPPNAKSSR